jgi:aminoglycoside phosphotransferase family enzyme|tara:strand:+ start:671 stop:886 length:216 start_codon:yes stop_codon:yes gene_type:complete
MGRYNDEDDGNYTEYTLTMRRYQNHDTVNDVSSTFRSDDEDLEEILEHTSYFLQGCSFTYVKGLIADKESS